MEQIIKISISSVHLAGGESQVKAQEKVALSVFNTGPNLQQEDLEKIWHSFYKTDKARKRDEGGTGLGLSIVRVIQEKDKNRYGVRNLEKGVEFWIELTKG